MNFIEDRLKKRGVRKNLKKLGANVKELALVANI
jgi:hypothetical protein